MPAPDFQTWVDDNIKNGAYDKRLGTPMTDDEKIWAAHVAPKVLASAALPEVIETTATEVVALSGPELLGKVVGAIVEIPHPTQIVNASKLVTIQE